MCSPLGAACAPHYRSHCRAGQRVCLLCGCRFFVHSYCVNLINRTTQDLPAHFKGVVEPFLAKVVYLRMV